MDTERQGGKVIAVLIAVIMVIVIAVSLIRILISSNNNEIGENEISKDTPESTLPDTEDTVQGDDGKIYKREKYIKAVMCLGVDTDRSMYEKRQAGSGGHADSIALIAWDIARNEVKILMIPRDTMTDIMLTDINGNELGKSKQHITMAYAYGDGKQLSCEYTRSALSELLSGLDIDFYVALNVNAISILNDDVGGVSVTINDDSMEEVYPELKKGSFVKLDGEQAEFFVRYRDINEDFTAIKRMDNQKEYIKGFHNALKKQGSKKDSLIEKLIDDINPYMVTDMEKAELLKLGADGAQSSDLTEEDILVIPGKSVTTELYDEYYPDKNGVKKMVIDLFYREVQ